MLNITIIGSAYVSQFEWIAERNLLVANWTDLVSDPQSERPDSQNFAVTSERTGRTVQFSRLGSMWERDNEGEPDGYHIWDDLQGTTHDGRTLTLRIVSMGVNEQARKNSPVVGWSNDYDIDPDLCAKALEIEWDTDLAREAHEEMQREGEVIAAEESWAAGFSNFIDGRGNGTGRW